MFPTREEIFSGKQYVPEWFNLILGRIRSHLESILIAIIREAPLHLPLECMSQSLFDISTRQASRARAMSAKIISYVDLE